MNLSHLVVQRLVNRMCIQNRKAEVSFASTQKQCASYLNFAQQHPKRCIVVDANQKIEAVVEEIIEKLILGVPFLVPLAPVVTAVIVGSLTAITISLIAYLIDKMDILGVIKAQETRFILDNFNKDIDKKLQRCESISQEIDKLLSPNSPLLMQSI